MDRAGLVKKAKGAVRPLVGVVAQRRAARLRPAGRQLVPADWGLTRDEQGRLLIQGISVDELVERHGGPLHIVNGEAIRRNAARFLQLDEQGRQRVEVYYSYKSNPVPGVLQLLDQAGIGAEVTSHFELWLALQIGIEPSRIIFNGPGKSEDALRLAVSSGIQVININQLEEVERLARVARELGATKVPVGIRVSTSGTWQGQFATPASHALEVFVAARDTGVLDVIGLHQHIGGHIDTPERLTRPVDEVLDFVEMLEDEHGFELQILNLGGGLANPSTYNFTAAEHANNVHYGTPLPMPVLDATLSIEDFVRIASDHVAARYRSRGRAVPRIFLEPGRGLTANTQMLVSSVLTERHTPERDFLVMDAGINVLPGLVSEFHHIMVTDEKPGSHDHQYRLVGPTCAPWDMLLHSWYGPELHTGDRLVVMDTGAYFVPMATTFSFPEPGVLLVDEGREQMLRREEAFTDIIALDVRPDGSPLV